MSHAHQCPQQEIGRLAVESRDRDEPAEIDQVMHPLPLFFTVFAHDFHHVITGLSTPHMPVKGTGPK